MELVPAHAYVPPSDCPQDVYIWETHRHLMLSEVCPPLQDMAPVPSHHSVETRVSHPARGRPWTADALRTGAG